MASPIVSVTYEVTLLGMLLHSISYYTAFGKMDMIWIIFKSFKIMAKLQQNYFDAFLGFFINKR